MSEWQTPGEKPAYTARALVTPERTRLGVNEPGGGP